MSIIGKYVSSIGKYAIQWQNDRPETRSIDQPMNVK